MFALRMVVIFQDLSSLRHLEPSFIESYLALHYQKTCINLFVLQGMLGS